MEGIVSKNKYGIKLKPSENNLVAFLVEMKWGIMNRCRMGNPKKRSKFICFRWLKINRLGDGMQRVEQY